jgi:UDP-GlcNAc:undecaprenyl-phosphate GlcNAc-1-phosphate transferase
MAFAVTTIVTPIVRWIAGATGTVDDPARNPERKLHKRPVALLGGLAVAFGFAVAVTVAALHPSHPFAVFPSLRIWVTAAAVLLVLIGGVLDDRRNLPARIQILFPLAAALLVVLGGVTITFITNPLGGVLRFDALRIPLPWLSEGLPLVGALLTVVWLLATTNAAKLLDGLDGLVTGIGAIGALTIFILSVRPPVNQPETAILAAALAGACLGFLPWNWHPAKIFLGEAGAVGIGFTLGLLSIISGGKIATALLILGLPILDVLWVMLRRMFRERRSPFAHADRKHLHHRLLALGLSHRGAVLTLYLLTFTFGAFAIQTAGPRKFAALILLLAVMLLLALVLVLRAPRPPQTPST